MNRGNGRATVFHNADDYDEFLRLMQRACLRIPMRVLAYCIMPNHFHTVLWPIEDNDLSRWLHWLLTCHVRRHHSLRGTSGRIWQGRFKAFPIQSDVHLLSVMRYVERNPLRARLVSSADQWQWSSVHPVASEHWPGLTTPGPVKKRRDWLDWVNAPQTAAEVAAIRRCRDRNAPFGQSGWVSTTAAELGLESSITPVGRPAAAPRESPAG